MRPRRSTWRWMRAVMLSLTLSMRPVMRSISLSVVSIRCWMALLISLSTPFRSSASSSMRVSLSRAGKGELDAASASGKKMDHQHVPIWLSYLLFVNPTDSVDAHLPFS